MGPALAEKAVSILRQEPGGVVSVGVGCESPRVRLSGILIYPVRSGSGRDGGEFVHDTLRVSLSVILGRSKPVLVGVLRERFPPVVQFD
jgi:hypothetical protein